MTVVEFFRFLRRNFWLILATAVLVLGAVGVWTWFQPRIYQASSTGYVVTGASDTVIEAQQGNSLANTKATQYLPLADTKAVADRIAADLAAQGLGYSPTPISASLIAESNIVSITAKAGSPEQAQAVADAGVRAMSAEIHRLETLDPTSVTDDPSSIDEIPATGKSTIALVPFEPAGLPTAPVSPDWNRNLVIGLVSGLALGLVIAFLKAQLDVRVRTSKQVEELTGKGVLAVIPSSRELAQLRRKPGSTKLPGAVAEAIRYLRTNLRFVSVDEPPRAVVITSPNPAEGKSTIAAQLTRAIAAGGQPTLLIDADLRRPMQAKVFELDDSVGLSQALVGDVDVRDAIQATKYPNLHVLTAGRIPPNPSELVGSRQMERLLQALRNYYLVVIDAPPVLPVSDAGLLTAASDGAVLVSVVGRTHREQVSLSARRLNQVGAVMLGSVLNQAPAKKVGEVEYGYASYGGYRKKSYSYGYQHSEQELKGAAVTPTDLLPPGLLAPRTKTPPSRAIPGE